MAKVGPQRKHFPMFRDGSRRFAWADSAARAGPGGYCVEDPALGFSE